METEDTRNGDKQENSSSTMTKESKVTVGTPEESRRIPSIDGELSGVDTRSRKPKRILHFSDGVMEEYSSEEEQEGVDEGVEKSPVAAGEGGPVVDPRTLTWLPWIYYRAFAAGGSFVTILDTVGEKLAWWMGITSPKYYYEIQEALRVKAAEEKEKKDVDAEMAGWKETRASPAVTTRAQPSSYQSTLTTVLQQQQDQ
eukprot:TRINITY_DN8188_c0_g1_i2.p1 TRINITY_DN8188_c0_g1~~TRINITY_DN8188_c0_g1_i2.p1  ORF type:complete len:199 (-),score=61.34 TRINITY_DN8188_c0_g1_i2:802-1398(-)